MEVLVSQADPHHATYMTSSLVTVVDVHWWQFTRGLCGPLDKPGFTHIISNTANSLSGQPIASKRLRTHPEARERHSSPQCYQISSILPRSSATSMPRREHFRNFRQQGGPQF